MEHKTLNNGLKTGASGDLSLIRKIDQYYGYTDNRCFSYG